MNIVANNTTGFGFQQIGTAIGSPPTFGARRYPINYSNATTIGKGCLVTLGADGYISLSTTGDSGFLGVFDGGYKTDTSLPQRYTQFNAYIYSSTAVSGSVYGYVIDDPNATFEGRVSGGPLATTDVGGNVSFVAGTTNTTTGLSTDLVSATVATNATMPWRVVGLGLGVSNDNSSTYNIVQVKLNASQLGSTTGQTT